jgi:hypothetical protein
MPAVIPYLIQTTRKKLGVLEFGVHGGTSLLFLSPTCSIGAFTTPYKTRLNPLAHCALLGVKDVINISIILLALLVRVLLEDCALIRFFLCILP